jgi:hypothetical protein
MSTTKVVEIMQWIIDIFEVFFLRIHTKSYLFYLTEVRYIVAMDRYDYVLYILLQNPDLDLTGTRTLFGLVNHIMKVVNKFFIWHYFIRHTSISFLVETITVV